MTSTVDARPVQCLRVPGPSFIPMWAAAFTGGAFVFATFAWYWMAGASAAGALAAILAWVWTGTAWIPEKKEKDVGRGLVLPIYVSGPKAVGWWAMFITMTGDATAYAGLVFGYFFFWTVHENFPPLGVEGPGQAWPLAALLLGLASWGATWLAARRNAAGGTGTLRLLMPTAVLLAAAAIAAAVAGPWQAGLDPTAHAYPATIWVLVLWLGLHLGLGVVMQLYCLARSLAGRLTPAYDADIRNVALYWHFMAVTLAVWFAPWSRFSRWRREAPWRTHARTG